MTKPNFASILDKPASDISRPKPLPVGTYLAVVEGLPSFDKSTKKQTPFIEFTHRITAAADDVDEEELNEVGLTLKDGTPRTMKATFYYDPNDTNSLWRVKKYLNDLGFDFSNGESIREAAEASANHEIYITVGHEPSQDGQAVFGKITGTAKVE